jgi:hypothetical protein
MPLLSQQTLRRLLALATLTLLSATLAFAQDTSQPDNRDFAKKGTDNWEYAASIGSPQKKLFVVTMTDPTNRHTCHIQSFTADQLVCKGPFNEIRAYRPQDVTALIIPGSHTNVLAWFLGINAAGAAAMGGTQTPSFYLAPGQTLQVKLR